MSLIFALLIVAAFVELIVGLVVYATSHNRQNLFFAIFTVISVFWCVGDAFALFLSGDIARLGIVLFLIAPLFVTLFITYFSYIFPRGGKLPAGLKWVAIVPVSYTIFLLLAADKVMGINPAAVGSQVVVHSQLLYFFYALYFFFFLSLAQYFLFRSYKKTHGQAQLQTGYTLFALAITSVVSAVTNLGLPLFGITEYIWAGASAGLLTAVIIAVAIVRHRLFDIRLVVARALGYALSLTVLASLYGFIVFGIANWIFDLQISLVSQIFLSAATGLAALSFQRIKKFFDKGTNAIFYRDAYDVQELFDRLNRVLVSSLDVRHLMMQSISVIETALKSSYILIGLREGPDGYRIFASQKRNFNDSDIDHVRHLTPRVHHKVIVADFIDDPRQQELKELMLKNNVAVLVRLTQDVRRNQEGLGYLVLGNKRSGNPYTEQDVRVLEAVSSEMIIAIQNALHYEEIQNFNATLQQQVDEATRKLRRTNEKLKALDETKDDFISMASHQLRTPLTSVKGYLSMVLEGDAGKITPTQQKMLSQAFTSSQRMVYLIADLLNVSRLKTGKFVIEPHPTNLANMIEEELAQLTESAASRELKLTFNKPKDFPELMLDETKTRQVVMNFIDNAIYYTPAGGTIRVELAANDSSVELRVVDNGIGVPKSEQHHLFTKFYRAGNARKARPDGTGLGLFMAKKVIVAQGGNLIFESKEGQGSTFGFNFSRRKLTPPAIVDEPVKSAIGPPKKAAK